MCRAMKSSAIKVSFYSLKPADFLMTGLSSPFLLETPTVVFARFSVCFEGAVKMLENHLECHFSNICRLFSQSDAGFG